MGEYEPDDSRNVTGTASTPDGRWTNRAGKTPPGVPDPGKPAPAGKRAAGVADARKKEEDPLPEDDAGDCPDDR